MTFCGNLTVDHISIMNRNDEIWKGQEDRKDDDVDSDDSNDSKGVGRTELPNHHIKELFMVVRPGGAGGIPEVRR